MYEHVLPFLGLPYVRSYGFVEETEEINWLLLEDIGEEPCDLSNGEHRMALIQWLAALHSFSLADDLQKLLPDRGSPWFRERMHVALHDMAKYRTNPILTRHHLKILSAIETWFGIAEANWGQIDSLCRRLPRVVVHGDLGEKRLRTTKTEVGFVFQTFDWEHAGMGQPGIDLYPFLSSFDRNDFTRYRSLLEMQGPKLSDDDLKVALALALLFRKIDSIQRAAPLICDHQADEGMLQLENDERSLHRALVELRGILVTGG